jgi:glycine cleavage system H protein
MPDLLECTSDKFIFRVATDRLYSRDGLWVLPEQPGRVRIGLTDFMQQRSGDLAFLSVKALGTTVLAGDEFAEMETVKVTQTIPSPVTGTIREVNKALDESPEVVNGDPYGGGWLAAMEPTDWEKDRSKLLDPNAYFSVMQSEIEQENANR